METHLITYPTWERYTILAHRIASLTIRERRTIFQLLRAHENVQGDLFLPEYGFTVGEFAVWHLLGEHRRKSRKKQSASQSQMR